MRVVLAHAYHHVDQDIIGAVVARDIPALQRDLAAIIGDLPAGD
ncbi:unannotated protein [freshwater metagenome]|uniref:Unannotated protein n=1 Tax=freshwater metagenome TaxID=449393 RepID=A0A6J6DZN3_9ZZZZ